MKIIFASIVTKAILEAYWMLHQKKHPFKEYKKNKNASSSKKVNEIEYTSTAEDWLSCATMSKSACVGSNDVQEENEMTKLYQETFHFGSHLVELCI